MSYESVREIINRSDMFTLAQKRVLRNIFDVNYTDLAANATADAPLKTQTTGAGTGITTGTGTIAKWNIVQSGDLIKSELFIDLTGLHVSTTDLDIIGKTGTANSHFGQVLTADHGTLIAGHMTCLEVPVGGITDIDLYSATEATGTEDAGIAALAEVATVTSGAVWTIGRTLPFIALPATTKYLYLTAGAGGSAGDLTAGQFVITLWGTP